MDRGRRAEPYSNATIWTREVARNLAGHLERLSKVHSCVDTASPKSSHLPQFKHGQHPVKRVSKVSPLKFDHHPASAPFPQRASDIDNDVSDGLNIQVDSEAHNDSVIPPSANSREEEPETPTARPRMKPLKHVRDVSKRILHHRDQEIQDAIAHENQRLQDRIAKISGSPRAKEHDQVIPSSAPQQPKKAGMQDYHRRQEQQKIWQENQAMAKRLRNTKPTLSSKDWEKDDKWNQQFLKTHERHRQALQNEMARTLASPHSALLRVKNVQPSAGSVTRRSDAVDGDSREALTAIEVTTAGDTVCGNPAKSSVRTLRRRRSSGDDAGGDQRRHSSSANHRRIMELRKQRECNYDGTDDTDGPSDELVSVRFTFSRGGTRYECSTPNGITGQFSPAVELEAALESKWSKDDEDTPVVPTLDPPISGRLDKDHEDDVHQAVSSTLQRCIDSIVDAQALPKDQVSEVSPPALTNPDTIGLAPGISNEPTNNDEVVLKSEATAEVQSEVPPAEVDGAHTGGSTVATEATEEYDADDLTSEGHYTNRSHESDEPSSPSREPAGRDMEASGYGSEFDVEDDPHEPHSQADVPPPVQEADNDEYEDDDHVDDTARSLPSARNEYEEHFEDDPEQDANDGYSEDGFTHDE